MGFTREPLLKGKAQYSWPTSTYYLIIEAFDIANIFYFMYKTNYPNEEVMKQSLPLQLEFPGFMITYVAYVYDRHFYFFNNKINDNKLLQ